MEFHISSANMGPMTIKATRARPVRNLVEGYLIEYYSPLQQHLMKCPFLEKLEITVACFYYQLVV